MLDVEVIDDPVAAMTTLDPKRARLLAEMAEPISAATLAARVGLARQKVNYHLRALEKHGLVEETEQRRWGGLTERLLVARAASYVVSPAALGPVATDPRRTRDRLSAGYLIALGARVVQEVSQLLRRSRETGEAVGDPLDRHRDPLPVRGGSAPRAAGSSPRRWPSSSRATTTKRRRGAAGIAW